MSSFRFKQNHIDSFNIQANIVKIAEEENGLKIVKTKSGYIHVLTDTKIIEVNNCVNWKHAIGNVLCNAFEYEDKEMWIYLSKHEAYCDKEVLSSCCNKLNIQVKYIEENKYLSEERTEDI